MGAISAAGLAPLLVSSSSLDTSATAASTQNRAIAQAVRDLNSSGYTGSGRQVNLSRDHATGEPVITVVDAETGQVITQWPTQYLLDVAAEINSRFKTQRQNSA
jgi:uncharacterized FlaG/YvyC family protein